MIVNPQVPIHRLILSLSQALDYVHPDIADHQQRVAYIALRLGRNLDVNDKFMLDLFRAAALHDIGLVGLENKILSLCQGTSEEVNWYAEVGYELLRSNPLFARAAEIIRYHYLPWSDGRGDECNGQRVSFASHILHLADYVERLIDRNVAVLDQSGRIITRITELAGTEFHPDCVEAFRDAARQECFWLDCVSTRIYSVLLEQLQWPTLTVDLKTVEPIAKMFALIVDAASNWTATHSVGVASSAVTLAGVLNFSPRELMLMRAAGYLHDLGKLAIPTSILDKPGKLTSEEWNSIKGHPYFTFRILSTIGGVPQISEWAAFHHERLDGNGYPFHHTGQDLTLGSRIMAVADMFTALTEDRPYRPGMDRSKTLSILEESASSGALDPDVVAALKHHYDQINEIRLNEQVTYEDEHRRLTEIINSVQPLAV